MTKRNRRPYKVAEEKGKAYLKERPDNCLREIVEAFGISRTAIFYNRKFG